MPARTRHDPPKARCNDCGQAWYGRSAAHALALLGHCVHCQGDLTYAEALPELEDVAAPAVGVPAHLVMGNPRR